MLYINQSGILSLSMVWNTDTESEYWVCTQEVLETPGQTGLLSYQKYLLLRKKNSLCCWPMNLTRKPCIKAGENLKESMAL
jgi:hypothetical protein